MSKQGWNWHWDCLPISPMPPWAAGRFYSATLANTSGSTTYANLYDDFFFVPFYVPNLFGVVATSVGVEVTAAADAGSHGRVGLYRDEDGNPGGLIIDAGQISTDGIAYQSATISKWVDQGWLWAALIFERATTTNATVRANGNAYGIPDLGYGSGLDVLYRTCLRITVSSYSGAQFVANGLPATAQLLAPIAAATLNNSNVPRVMIGV